MVNLETRIKKRRKILFGLVILLMVLFTIDFGLTQNQIPQPISYDFYDNTLINKDSSFIPSMYNIDDNIESWTQNYVAYDSFDNDVGGYPSGTVVENGDTSINVISEKDGHDSVVRFLDEDNSNECSLTYDAPSNMSLGTISFWCYNDPNSSPDVSRADFKLYADSVLLVHLYITNNPEGRLKTSGGGGIIGVYSNIIPRKWIHYGIEFNCDTQLFKVYINGVAMTTEFQFVSGVSVRDVNKIYFGSSTSNDIPYNFYIDGLDFSNSAGYYENRNFKPQTEKEIGFQKDKYEFDYTSGNFEGNNTIFKQIEKDVNSNEVYLNRLNDIDSEIIITENPDAASTYYTGVQCDIALDSELVRFSSKFELYSSGTMMTISYFIYPYDIDPEYPFIFNVGHVSGNEPEATIYDQRKGQYISFQYIEYNTEYEIEVFFNFRDCYWFFTLSSNEVLYEYVALFSLRHDELAGWRNSHGIETIRITGYQSAALDNECVFALKNVGIYDDGYAYFPENEPSEYGLLNYYVGQYDLREFNLITLDFEYTNELLIYNNLDFSNPIVISAYPSYTYEKTYNLYTSTVYNNAYLGLKVYGNFSLPEVVKIHGVSLLYNNKLAIPTYYYENCNYSNYYYVDGNKLYYNFSRDDYNQNETMSMRFLVDDYYVYNESFKYTSYIENNYNATITLMTSNMEYYQSFKATSSLSTQTTELDTLNNTDIGQIWISVACFDDDYADGYADGYITNLDVIPFSSLYDFDDIDDLGLGFTDGLIYVSIRLAMFILPCFIVLYIFGYKSLVPFWLLMLIIYFMFSVIPFWMVAIQSIALLMMFIIPKKERDD